MVGGSAYLALLFLTVFVVVILQANPEIFQNMDWKPQINIVYDMEQNLPLNDAVSSNSKNKENNKKNENFVKMLEEKAKSKKPLYTDNYVSFTSGEKGKQFSVPAVYFRQALLFSITKPKPFDDVVFVTAASDDHFYGAVLSLRRMRQAFPKAKLIFYGLALSEDNPEKRVKDIANVEFRTFNFSNYPDHVRRLKNYSFKMLIFSEVLRDCRKFSWVDSTMDVRGNIEYYKQLFHTPKATTPLYGNHGNTPIGQATHPKMLSYFPLSLKTLREGRFIMGGNVFVQRPKTTFIRNSVLYWIFLCALDPNCISPEGVRKCSPVRQDLWKGGHSFDMSLMSCVLGDRYIDVEKYAQTLNNINDRESSRGKHF